MGFRGIKSRVLVLFWFLFFLSMIFLDILIISIALQHSLSQLTRQKHAALTLACQTHSTWFQGGNREHNFVFPDELPDADRFFAVAHDPTEPTDHYSGKRANDLEGLVYKTLQTGNEVTQHLGRSFGIFHWQSRSLVITRIVQSAGTTVAAAGIEVDLTGIYKDYRRIQKIAFVFVFIISLFFALIANRQLMQIYFKPLKRLAVRAESYQDEDPLFFSVRKEDNEFSVLSSSLNKMLNRINEDKRVLQETIGSLQAANQELKQAQNDIIRAEKLATVGRLTSGIAHEIGNPIGIVLGYLDLMKQPDISSKERGDFIDRSEKEITRINHIIRQLLDMTRTSSSKSKPIAVHPLLEDLVSVFSYQPSANQIVFESRPNASDDLVVADPEQLRQVFLNILLNAVDAINSKPPLAPRIQLITHLPIDENGSGGMDTKNVIEIQIQDNGPGIQPSDLNHVFDPFFTTKQPGKGTGLGLSVSFMIIEKLGGKISVSSSEDAGTLFRVRLPLAAFNPHARESIGR